MVFLWALVSLIAAGVLYQWLGTRRQRPLLRPPGSLLDVGGHRLHAMCSGEGETAVLLESGIAARR